MSHLNDFSDLFNMDELDTFDKLDDYNSPNLSPVKPTAFASSSPPSAKNANFLVKLYMALQEEPPSSAVYWSADGKQLVVASPGLLEKDILPKYWKHNKFASFGRQLNIYGFSRVYPGRSFKDENGNIRDDASVWSHPTLHRESTLDEIIAIKRRAAPKLFRSRKLANGQVVQIRAGSQVEAKFNTLRAEKQDKFIRKAPDPYHVSNYHLAQHTPTFCHSSDVRYSQDLIEGGTPQWAYGSYSSPASDQAHLSGAYNHQQNLGLYPPIGPNHYVSETVMASLQASNMQPRDIQQDSEKPISPIDIIQSIPDVGLCAPAANPGWMQDGRQGLRPHELQAMQTQGMPPLSWTTPSSPTGLFPFRERWNSSATQQAATRGVFRHEMSHNRDVFCTAPASPLQATHPLAIQTHEDQPTSVGYPVTPQDVKFNPADMNQFIHKPFDQTYLFSQQQHTVPFSAVETSQPSFEHVDVPVPASADVYGRTRYEDLDGHVFQDIWPVNLMNTMTMAKPLPLPLNSPDMVGGVGMGDGQVGLPYATTYRYTVPSAAGTMYPNIQGF